MKYDFAHPRFKNGQPVFDKKEKPLFDMLRERLLRLRVVVRPDASIYLNGHCYARIRNYGHSLEIIRPNDSRREYLRSESDINRFVGELVDMKESLKLRIARRILRENGYIAYN